MFHRWCRTGVLVLRYTLIGLLILSVFAAGVLIYTEFFLVKEVCAIEAVDHHYTIVLYQIGSPGWPFGSVTARLVVKNSSGWIIDQCTFELNNDGGCVYGSNLKDVLWFRDRVEITMRGADDRENTVYILKLS